MVVKPKRRPVPLPVRPLLLFGVGFVLFKALLIAHLGDAAYAERVTALSTGSLPEQAGAFVMQIDVVSLWLALEIGPLLR